MCACGMLPVPMSNAVSESVVICMGTGCHCLRVLPNCQRKTRRARSPTQTAGTLCVSTISHQPSLSPIPPLCSHLPVFTSLMSTSQKQPVLVFHLYVVRTTRPLTIHVSNQNQNPVPVLHSLSPHQDLMNVLCEAYRYDSGLPGIRSAGVHLNLNLPSWGVGGGGRV